MTPNRAVLTATIAMVAWGALAFGGNYPWAYWPLVTVALVTGVSGLILRNPESRFPAMLAVALTAIAVAILIQLWPLSSSTLLRWSPATDTLLREELLGYMDATVPVHALSIDPRSTWTALAFLCSYGTLMLGTSVMLTKPLLRSLAWGITCVGALLALVGIVQAPFFREKLYGFWQPETPGSSFGPFVNHNHFAGWMLMGLPLAITFAISCVHRTRRRVNPGLRNRILWLGSRDASESILAGMAAALMGLSLIMTSSRSGILSCAVLLVLIGWKVSTRVGAGGLRLGLLFILATLPVAIVGWVGLPGLAAHFTNAGVESFGGRMAIWRDTLSIVRDFPLTGTGLNTYSFATLHYQTVPGDGHWAQAHSDYLQLAAEGGLLLCVPILAAILIFVREIRRRFGPEQTGSVYWLRFGACCGLVGIAIQSAADFSLQMPGNAVLFAVLAGIALHGGDDQAASLA